jgi:hypothetical protein
VGVGVGADQDGEVDVVAAANDSAAASRRRPNIIMLQYNTI